MELTQHPLSAAFPSMSAEDFQALKDDIENNGQGEPIMLFEGMVLDGWHRYRACDELGLKADRFEYKGDDPVAYVLTHNLHRRHLTASQRAAAVVACSAWTPANIGRPRVEPSSTLAKTNAEMAKAAQVTPRTITDAKVAHKAGLGDAVKEGVITAKEGASIARGTPAKAAAPKAAAPAEDFGPDEKEIADARRAQEEEVAALMKLAAADDKLAAAIADAKQLRALNRVLQERNDGLMNEKNELVKRIKALQRKVDKLEKSELPA